MLRRLARNIARNYAQAQGVQHVNKRMSETWRKYLGDAISEYHRRELLRKRQAETLAKRAKAATHSV